MSLVDMNDSSSISPDGFLLPKWWELTFHRPIWQVSYSIFLCACDVHCRTLQPSLCSLSLLSSAFSLSLLLVHSWTLSQWPLTTLREDSSRLHEPQLANNQSLGGSWLWGGERKNWLPNVSEKSEWIARSVQNLFTSLECVASLVRAESVQLSSPDD